MKPDDIKAVYKDGNIIGYILCIRLWDYAISIKTEPEANWSGKFEHEDDAEAFLRRLS